MPLTVTHCSRQWLARQSLHGDAQNKFAFYYEIEPQKTPHTQWSTEMVITTRMRHWTEHASVRAIADHVKMYAARAHKMSPSL